MWLKIKFAFRNVFRNSKRSLLTASSIFFASIIVAFALGFINGMINSFVGNYVKYQTGNFKVTTKGYVKLEKFIPVDEYFTLDEPKMNQMKSIRGVNGIEERVRFGIMLGRDENTESALGFGVDLLKSKWDLPKHLKEGSMEADGLYIGSQLAKKIGARLGDELLLVTKTSEGGLNGIKQKVKGIVATGIGNFDKRCFFISLESAKKLLKLPNGTTELYVYTDKSANAAFIAQELKKILPEYLVARTPREQVGNMFDLIISAKMIYYVIDLFILFLASFVVINTMMMAVFERVREIGTLKAMGMTEREIFVNFTLEGAIIGAIGGIAGSITGYILVILSSINGLDFTAAMKGVDMPLSNVIYPAIGIEIPVISILFSITMTAAAAMIPARYARRFTPAEALRKI